MSSTKILINPSLLAHLAEVDEDRHYLVTPDQFARLARILLPILRHATPPELKATRFRLQASTNGTSLGSGTETLEAVARLETFLDLFDAALEARQTPSRKAFQLTGRERKVLAFVDVWTGQTNRAIAWHTNLDPPATSKVCRHLHELGLIESLRSGRENAWIVTPAGAAINDELDPLRAIPEQLPAHTPRAIAEQLSGRAIRILAYLADRAGLEEALGDYSLATTPGISGGTGFDLKTITKTCRQLHRQGLLEKHKADGQTSWLLTPNGQEVLGQIGFLP